MEHTKAQDDHQSEQQRLEGQHEIMVYHMGKQVYPPIDFSKPGLKILDSGCANGRWLRDLKASARAEHEYFGTDIDESLYPSPPPETMHFQNQSIKEAFPSEWSNTFDLVHQRFVMAGASPETVPSVVERLAKMIKPGGWLQLVEMNTDPIPGNGPMLNQFMQMLGELFSLIGIGGNFAQGMADNMESAGLKNVESKEVYVAHGATIKDKSLLEKSIVSPTSAVAPVLAAFTGQCLFRLSDSQSADACVALPNSFSKDELEGYEGRLRKELQEKGGHTRIMIVYGQKPLE